MAESTTQTGQAKQGVPYLGSKTPASQHMVCLKSQGEGLVTEGDGPHSMLCLQAACALMIRETCVAAMQGRLSATSWRVSELVVPAS